MRFSLFGGFLCGHLGTHVCIIFFYKAPCTGLVSVMGQDLCLLERDNVLDSFLKPSVTVYPLSQLYLPKNFSLWQHCCESPQSHNLLAGAVTSHSHGHVALVPSTVVTVSTILHKKQDSCCCCAKHHKYIDYRIQFNSNPV